jgi:uncharacterized protein
MMATANVGVAIRDLNHRIEGIATALVSRDGHVLSADMPEGAAAETLAILCVTVWGAAATGNRELGRGTPDHVVVEGEDSRMVLMGVGSQALLVAVIDRSHDLASVLELVAKFADLLATG